MRHDCHVRHLGERARVLAPIPGNNACAYLQQTRASARARRQNVHRAKEFSSHCEATTCDATRKWVGLTSYGLCIYLICTRDAIADEDFRRQTESGQTAVRTHARTGSPTIEYQSCHLVPMGTRCLRTQKLRHPPPHSQATRSQTRRPTVTQ